jgi:4-amino-4-deoxy-L-arabinose transferase-like glycosyltransferase
VLIGLGFLSKYGYGVFLLALIFAFLTRRDTRAALLRRELLIAPILALVVLSPFLYWLIDTRADLVAMSYDNLVEAKASYVDRVLTGLDKFAQSSLRFLVPWPIILAIAVWEGRRRDSERIARANPGEWIAGLVIAFSVAITAGGIVAFGLTKITVGYIVPIWIAVMPYSAGLLARAAPGMIGPRRLAVLSLTVLALITLARLIYLGNSGFSDTSHRREMWPFAGLASAMREAGIDSGTLVAINEREAGNLRAEFPKMRVLRPDMHGPLRPPRGQDMSCYLIWNNTIAIAPGKRWASPRDSETVAGMERLADKEQRHFDIPWAETYIGVRRISRWTLVDLDPDDPLCR